MVLFIVTNTLVIVAGFVIPITIMTVIYRNKFKLHPLEFTFSYFKN